METKKLHTDLPGHGDEVEGWLSMDSEVPVRNRFLYSKLPTRTPSPPQVICLYSKLAPPHPNPNPHPQNSVWFTKMQKEIAKLLVRTLNKKKLTIV